MLRIRGACLDGPHVFDKVVFRNMFHHISVGLSAPPIIGIVAFDVQAYTVVEGVTAITGSFLSTSLLASTSTNTTIQVGILAL